VTNVDGSVSSTLSNKGGEYILRVPWRDRLKINAEKDDYIPGYIDVKTNPRSSYLDNVDITLKKLDFGVGGKVLLADNLLPLPESVVRLYDVDGTLLDSLVVTGDGAYFFPLPEGKSFVVEASKLDFITLSTEVNSKNPEAKVTNYDFKLFKLEKGTIVRLDNIYYDYNKSNIRPDAAKELDKLVKILKENPSMKIELGSHSDSRGSDSYNLNLSSKRADSAVKYLISQGIESSRLVAKGYGETKILNRCKNGVECFEEEHQFNRRTEFKITDI
jgi:outer membrane protein OmpA-like peptidoglycan-associated protein